MTRQSNTFNYWAIPCNPNTSLRLMLKAVKFLSKRHFQCPETFSIYLIRWSSWHILAITFLLWLFWSKTLLNFVINEIHFPLVLLSGWNFWSLFWLFSLLLWWHYCCYNQLVRYRLFLSFRWCFQTFYSTYLCKPTALVELFWQEWLATSGTECTN